MIRARGHDLIRDTQTKWGGWSSRLRQHTMELRLDKATQARLRRVWDIVTDIKILFCKIVEGF